MIRRFVSALTLGCAVLLAGLSVTVTPAAAVEAQRVVSPRGIEAWLVEDHSIPVLSMKIGFFGGASLDPAGKEGLADMVSGLLDEGAGDMDSLAFQSRLQDRAISLSFDAARDSFSGALRTLSENRDEAFSLLRMSLQSPRFDEEPVERIRRQLLANLAFSSEDPDEIAQREWFAAVFPGHPYARPVEGTAETLKGLGRQDFVNFAARTFTRNRLKIGVAGDITPEALAPLLDATFGDLPAGEGDGRAGVADVMPLTGIQKQVQRQIPQSVAVFGAPAVAQQDPDFYPAYVASYILGGGGFSSRLMNEVREKRGLAYGVSSHLAPLDHAPLSLGQVASSASRIQQSLELVRSEWGKMQQSGPTARELEDAKTYLTGAYPLRFTSTATVASMLMTMQQSGYPIDHFQTRNDRIRAVTLEDVRRVCRTLFDPSRLSVVVVGP